MKIIKGITKGIDTVNEWLGRVFSFVTLITLVVILCEVVLRRLMNKPQIWTNDMICMSFGCYVILISAFGFLHKSFVCVDVFFAKLKPIAQKILHIITYLIFFVPFTFKLLPVCWRFWLKAYNIHELGYSVWQPPTWPIKFCLFLGLFLLSVQGVSEILKNLNWIIYYFRNGRKAPEEDDAPSVLESVLGESGAAEAQAQLDAQRAQATDKKEEV
ncbi:MAG: TRAP transporter small permease subunit [Oscillospiraceae bacterium]|nr:TRAP transporter small permease subunit [Oscillospiraceae bacterium]